MIRTFRTALLILPLLLASVVPPAVQAITTQDSASSSRMQWQSDEFADRGFSSGFELFYAGPDWFLNALSNPRARNPFASSFLIDSAGDRLGAENGYVGTLRDVFDVSLFSNIATYGGAASPKASAVTLSAFTATDLYWRTDGTAGGWTGTNWNLGSPTATGGTGYTTSTEANFTANSTVTFATATIGNVIVGDGVTGILVTVSNAGTFSTGGNIRTFDIGTNSTLTWTSQSISAAAANAGMGFIKNGGGTWSMGTWASSAYTGGFTLNAGTIIVTGSSFGTGPMTINGGTLQSSGGTTFTPSSLLIGGDFAFAGTGNDIWGMDVDIGSSDRTVTNNTTGTATRTFSGVIAGTGSLILTGTGGTGGIVLSAANTYSGGTTIGTGTTLNINNSGTSSNNSAIGTGTFTINGGTINNTTGGTITLATNNAQLWNGDFVFTGTRSLDLGTGTVTLNATRQVTVSANNLTVGGVISGSTFGITKAGAGNLTLKGVNSYGGATTINGGTITANTLANGGSNSSIGSSSNIASNLVLNGGVLQYDGTTAATTNRLFTIGTAGAQLWNNSSSSSSTVNFTNAGAITVSGTGDRTLTLRGLNTGNNTLSPILVNPSSGMLSIVADNVGKWILAGNNTYTGATTVSAGTLLINGVQTSATGNVNVSGGGTLLGGIGKTGGKVTIGGGGTPGSGSVILGGDGTSASGTFTVQNNSTGAITLSNGSIIELALGASGAHSTLAHVGTGTISFASNQVFTFLDFGAQPGLYSSIVTGVGATIPTAPNTTGWAISDPGWGGTFAYNPLTDSIDLTLTAIPEPSTWIIGALALAAIGFTQRRRIHRLIARRA
jgi:autotransporter-associated beta strand protein